jgi:hypothetical protein
MLVSTGYCDSCLLIVGTGRRQPRRSEAPIHLWGDADRLLSLLASTIELKHNILIVGTGLAPVRLRGDAVVDEERRKRLYAYTSRDPGRTQAEYRFTDAG